MVVLRAVLLKPDHRSALANVLLGYCPGSRQCVVDRCYLVIDDVLVAFVEIEAFLDDGLIVLVQRDAAGFERARSAHTAGLDPQLIETTIAAGIEPLAYRVAVVIALELGREIAPVGVDA